MESVSPKRLECTVYKKLKQYVLLRIASEEEAMDKKAKRDGNPQMHIPHEVLSQILQKLPAKSLMKFTCVCKSWYESIMNDPRFIEAHFLESPKNPILLFDFEPESKGEMGNVANPYEKSTDHHYLFYLPKDEFGIRDTKTVLPHLHELTVLKSRRWITLRGNGNGLVYFRENVRHDEVDWSYVVTEIFNFSKREKLRIISRIHNPGNDFFINCCRLEYDCLSNEYKLICSLGYFCTYAAVTAGETEKYLVLTLGRSNTPLIWREIKNPASIPQGSSNQRSHCINGALYWLMNKTNDRVLVSFDLHEEKFQVIKLPQEFNACYSVDSYNLYDQLEYRRCFCLARIKNPDADSGVVELYLLEDRINQVWVKETIEYDLPVIPRPSSHDNESTALSEVGRRNTSIKIIEYTGRIFLYWENLLFRNGTRCRVLQFYDLHSREINRVRVGGECSSRYNVINHVENLISLRAWATKDGDGEIGRDYISDMFKQMAPSQSAALSFFSS